VFSIYTKAVTALAVGSGRGYEMRAMTMALVCLMLMVPAQAQEVRIWENDTVLSVLEARKGQRVTLRLASGQEMTGLVRETNHHLVVLGALTGREFFDAIVPIAAVEAVVVRTTKP
jgi:ribosomal protein L18E